MTMMLSDRRPILLANARIVDPSRDLDIVGDLLIADGVVREAKKGIGAAGVPEGTDVIDCRGKLVAPGLIDMRAFIGEPGEASRETLASASHAAAAGGVTTIICQPDTSPAIDNPATVDYVLRRARDTGIVHVHPMAAITKGLEGKEMTEIGLLKAAGAVAFTDGVKSVTNAQVMRRALTYAGDFDALIVHHVEDPNLVGDGVMNEGEFAARLGLLGIPKAAETIMLERDVRLVALSGGRYHAASVTCAETLDVLRRAKDAGLNVTSSASINHLTLNEIDIGPYRTFLKLSPPLRAEDDRKLLVQAVASGLVDVVVSDHNPQDVETKRLPFAEAAPGAIGLETMLSAGLRLVHSGEIELMALLRAMSTRPAELLGLPGGTLRSGAPADVIVVDTELPWVLDPNELKSKVQEHALRRSTVHRPCCPHDSRRANCLRVRMTAAIAFVFGYLLGSIPFGLLLTRAAGGPDIRAIGSGNIGATNVLRTGNKVLAAATLLCDMLKGTIAVLAAARYGADPALAAALGAFLGHLFPVWLKFKGGKGVATFIGLLIGLHWPAALFFCIVWLVVAAATRYSSLAALVASALTPFAIWYFALPSVAALFLLLTVLLWFMHRANIARLLNGSEGKIGAKASAAN